MIRVHLTGETHQTVDIDGDDWKGDGSLRIAKGGELVAQFAALEWRYVQRVEDDAK